MTPNIITQTNDHVRWNIARVRVVGRNPETLAMLRDALRFRRRARDITPRPASDHWIKLGL
jgi:hypothetical protein